MLDHGGRVRVAAKRHGIPPEEWLDLSTGINPNGWHVESLPAHVWSRLPEDDDELIEAAHSYYGTPSLWPAAGSQAAIQALPRLRSPCRVGVIAPGYNEHAHAWGQAGHAVAALAPDTLKENLGALDVLVLAHPNNPTGTRFCAETLLEWHAHLAARGGWLMVDEAYIDATPQHSLARFCPKPGLIVLRSLGKFFGLAGARVGFVLAEVNVLQRLHAVLGPWSVATPSRWIAAHALADSGWQERMRPGLHRDAERLGRLLARHRLKPRGGCALFQWVAIPDASVIHEKLASGGILTRFIPHPPSLRFGLPGNESEWLRLDLALHAVSAS